MTNEVFSATVFFKPGTLRPRKYRNVTNRTNFEKYCTRHGAYYVNYYSKKSKAFVCRVWLQDFNQQQQ